MPLIVEERESADTYDVQSGDTLESIAASQCADLGWEVLALFNWGTILPGELLRALIENIGVKVSDLSAPGIKEYQISLEPVDDLDTTIKIPKLWKKEGLELTAQHQLHTNRITPANAINILNLDKWFIPKVEECEIEYNLEGEEASADTLRIDVYGSSYCECSEWKDGFGKYDDPADLIDEPIYTSELEVEERKSKLLKWSGQATTSKGILGRKTGSETERYINVAFSPYTTHFCYWKVDADIDARLILEPFWPQWKEPVSEPVVTSDFTSGSASFDWTNAAEQDYGVLEVFDKTGQRVYFKVLDNSKLAAGSQQLTWSKNYTNGAQNGVFQDKYIDDSSETVPSETHLFISAPYSAKISTVKNEIDANSLKLKWQLKKTNAKLKRGHLRIIDGNNKTVFVAPLSEAKLADGSHEHSWDGKYPDGVKNSKDGDMAIAQDMPYRIKIEVNAGMDQAEGLALAAMHSEVRLYVHDRDYRTNDMRYDSFNCDPGMSFSKALYVPGTLPAEGDGTKWYRHKLAEYGFHPGPVTDSIRADDVYKIALKEFKRSVPADGSKTAADFTRLTLAASTDPEVENAETSTAIKTIRAGDKRQLFADTAKILSNNNAPDLTDVEFLSKITDTAEDIVVWVDDRQYNTESNAKDENNNAFLTGTAEREAFGLKNYRGRMSIADRRTDIDGVAISRPWVPLQVDLCLLSRNDDLHVSFDKNRVIKPSEDKRAAMRQAMGPLRVDWTFNELPMDLSTVDTSVYDTDFTRTRKYMGWAIYNNKSSHLRKDTARNALYTNCNEASGGIRPTDLTKYHEKSFGLKELSLAPWVAQGNSSTESVTTVIHEHLSSGQTADTDLFADSSVGRAGIYFNPSRIAGDGYQVRAEVVFDKFSGYEFPNLERLKARYPAGPSATSAKLRLWRRSSVRGFMCWGTDNGHWPDYLNGMRKQYRSAHTYFVHEGGNAPRQFPVTDVFDPTDNSHVTTYKNTIKNNTNAPHNNINKMQLRATDIWPWGHRDEMGQSHWMSQEGLTAAQLYSQWLSPTIITPTWRKFRTGLLLSLIKQVEKNGILRGHTLVEFDASPAIKILKYTCNGHNTHTYWVVRKDGAAALPSRTCPIPGCKTGPLPADPRSTLSDSGTSRFYASGFPLPAVGIALGATWLFTSHVSPETWAHEVGHHRHFEHAAAAPGAQYSTGPSGNNELHDSENNTLPDWAAVGEADPAKQRWDKHCTMSYDRTKLYFCGKCQLRNRGWKVQTLGYPGSKIREP